MDTTLGNTHPDTSRTDATNRRIEFWKTQLAATYPALDQQALLNLACSYVVAELEADDRKNPETVAQRVRDMHPRWNEKQVASEATFLLARYQDLACQPLDAGDTEARRQESAAAHASDANQHRGFYL